MPSFNRNRMVVVIVFLVCALFALARSGQIGKADAEPFAALTPGPTATATFTATGSPTPTDTATPTNTATPTPTQSCTPNAWMNLAPYPIAAYGVAITSNGGAVWGFGGKTTGGSEHAEFYQYVPSNNFWTAMPPMPTGPDYFLRADHWGDGRIYVIGGVNHGTQVRIFDLNAHNWSMGTPLPVAVHSHGQIRNDSKIYVIGGITGGVASAKVFAYDLFTSTWTPLAPLPQAEFNMACDTVGGLIYCAGGSTGNDQLANLYIYDVAANTWSAGPTMPIAVNAPGGTVLDDKFWIVGGGDQPGPGAPGSIDNTQIFDPAANSWSSGPPVLRARSFADAESVNTRDGEMAVFVAGYDAAAGSSVNDVEGYLAMCAGPSPEPTPFTPTQSPTPTHTPTPTVTPTCQPAYTTTSTPGAVLTPGNANIGSSCDDCVTSISLPFPVLLHGTTYTSTNADSNGVLAFTSSNSESMNTCLPSSAYTDSILAHWDDLTTDTVPDCEAFPDAACGIFTSVTGSAPDRTFVVEWRAAYAGRSGTANFEIVLHENTPNFEVVYGTLLDGGFSATVGVQEGQGGGNHFTQFACNNVFLNDRQVNFTFLSCVTPTPTSTSTGTPTPTSTGMNTPMATATSTAQSSPTGSPTATCTPPVILWDQTADAGTTSTSSQNFESTFDEFDARVADDFMVPSGSFWNVTHIDVGGQYFNGTGPASSVNVAFYNEGAFPGEPVCTFDEVPIVSGADTGSFGIDLPGICSLNSGIYWVSVQANLNFNPHGQWGWTDRTVQLFSGAAFRNPGGGYMCSSGDWVRKTACVGGTSPDQIFQLIGTNGMPCGTPLGTPTPPNTPAATATATATSTGTPTHTPTNTPTNTPTATATATSTPTTTPSPGAFLDLTIGQSDSPDPVNFGQELTYTLWVLNSPWPPGTNGVQACPHVRFGYPVGVPFDFVSATGTNGYVSVPDAGGITFLGCLPGYYGEATLTVVIRPLSTGTLTSLGSNVVVDPENDWYEHIENNNNAETITTTILAQATPTNTPTSTPTNTPTFTPNSTPTFTPTSTPTSTPTDTPTFTPTFTPTATPTASPTVQRRTAFDYDADGKADISVFRPSSGSWYLQRSMDGVFGAEFGYGTDKITPADYDGDGRADIAVYRPETGIWYIFDTSTGTVTYSFFGIAEDLPTPADYDGDGKADICVYRPSTATWYRQNSGDGSFYAIQFGASEDKPTIGDFDGDGKAEIAVFRPSVGAWYQINSSNGALSGEQFGFGSDIIAPPADYDGDGETDLAVFRPSNGFWYIKNSNGPVYTAYPFGLENDIPAAGDFDGDGKADISVFRPSDGIWYRLNSSDGSFFASQFGTAGDRPTQTAFTY